FYEPLTVVRAVVLLDRTEDRPRSLVTAEWDAAQLVDEPARLAEDVSGLDHLSFVAVLVDDDVTEAVGLVAALTVVPGDATELVRPIADQLSGSAAMKLTARRWQRGGRSQSDS
ncbi:MAG: uncharacterized protein QOH84_3983, partial [Kribbellaceae bacterium]|nr:uncharacterized protein [Kribbellaceae bacterium]